MRVNIESKINMNMPQVRGEQNEAKNSHPARPDAALLIRWYIFAILLPGNDSVKMNEVGMCYKL